MPKVSPLQGNFNAGEVSPLVYGRVDADRYKTALAKCLNYIPTIQGGLIRRSGTAFASESKDSSKAARLIPFEFSTVQAYMIEFGHQYIRFYKDNGLITLTPVTITGATQADPVVVTAAAHGYSNGDRVVITGIVGMTQLNNREFKVAGVAANTFQLIDPQTNVNVNGTAFDAYTSGGSVAKVYEIVSTYDQLDLFQLKFTQSADILYLVHPDYAPRTLTRTAHTSWTLAAMTLLDGPYLSANTTGTTLTPSGTTGSVTITASAVTGINDDTGFQTTDIGRVIRIKHSTSWGYARITARASTTSVTATVVTAFGATTASATWRMGLYSDTGGYPACVTFHEDRLFFGGCPESEQRLDGSRSSLYTDFTPTDTDGTITASHAVGFSFNANTVNTVRWIVSDEKGLLAGTSGGEWVVRPSSQLEALSPTNVNAKPATSYGSDDIQPVQVGKACLFVQRAGRKVREMAYFYDVDGFRAEDLTVLSEHITGTGLTQLAYQKEPQSLVWGVREDGVLVSMTYERDVDSFKVGWSRHILGGFSDAAESDAVVESVAVIPAPDASREEVWLIVKRRINGRTCRTVEYMTKLFEDTDEQKDAFLVDLGLTYDSPISISAATQSSPVVVTANSHGFSNGDSVMISDVLGMADLNGEIYLVTNKTANTFELRTPANNPVNGTAFDAYVSGGYARKLVSTISGLNHLEGQTVSILADGAVLPDQTVSSGKVTLTNPSGVVSIGFSYSSDGQLLRLEAGSADGTALGKTRRVHRVGMLLHRTLGMKLGMDFDEMDTVTFRTSSDPMTRAPALFSGIISENISAEYDFENQLAWRQDQPTPGMVLAVMPQMVTNDR